MGPADDEPMARWARPAALDGRTDRGRLPRHLRGEDPDDLPGGRSSRAAAPADFVIRLDEILTWDPPHEDSEVEVEDLQRIAAGITAECERRGLTAAFE